MTQYLLPEETVVGGISSSREEKTVRSIQGVGTLREDCGSKCTFSLQGLAVE